MSKYIKNTRLRIACVLGIIWIVYVFFHPDPYAFLFPPLSVVFVSFFDLLITFIRKRKLYFPASSFVTGFLIGLILAPANGSIVAFVLAAALAVFAKQFIRTREHQHIFNPAAFGIFATSIILNVPVAWWAVSWTPWTIPLIASVSYTLYQLKRLWLPITFLLTYSVYIFATNGKDGFALLLDGTVFLFALVMLPEPITSPNIGKWKYGFGVLVAVLSIVTGKIGELSDVFLPSLLLGNLIWFFVKTNLRSRKVLTTEVFCG